MCQCLSPICPITQVSCQGVKAASLFQLKPPRAKSKWVTQPGAESFCGKPILKRFRPVPSDDSVLVVAYSQFGFVECITGPTVCEFCEQPCQTVVAEMLCVHIILNLANQIYCRYTVCPHTHMPCCCSWSHPLSSSFSLTAPFFFILTHSRPLILSFIFILLAERLVRQ